MSLVPGTKAPTSPLVLVALVALVALAAGASGCGPSGPRGTGGRQTQEPEPEEPAIGADGVTSVELDFTARSAVKPHAFGIHGSVYDNALHDLDLPRLLDEAGVTLLRWPGGGYSDNYHWSNHSMTPWPGGDDGYLAEDSDFGSFVGLLDRVGARAMITVNYGSNLLGTGPGEPKEAAAWVAYANGDPADTRAIGVDSIGVDWRTVGHWASLRAAEPLADDDGQNFLRIARPEPIGIELWEVGNEVFGNGYHGDDYELDLHVPYDGTERRGHPLLGGTAYGRGVRDYVREMKSVDPTIRVGAVLNTPPADDGWGPNWNRDVLAACATVIDFGVVHWYMNGTPTSVVHAPRVVVPMMVERLRGLFQEHGGANASNIEIVMTELGPRFERPSDGELVVVYDRFDAAQRHATGLFATEAYVTGMEHGFANLDWLELHNGSFLHERSTQPGGAYFGIRMANELVSSGDTLITARPAHPASIIAHASERADGKLGILLINAGNSATAHVSVHVPGAALAPSGVRYDYEPSRDGAGAITAPGTVVGPTPLSGLGNPLSIDVPAFSATTILVDSFTR